MPINLFNNPLSSIKLGADDILKGYIGNGQIFPNSTSITAAGFDNAGSTMPNTGGNTPYTVSGDIGSSFSLQGTVGATAPSGTQVLATSPTTYQVAIGDQSTTCGAGLRYPVVTITPQGNTVFDPTNLTPTSNVVQSAGPSTVPNSIGLTMSVSNAVYNTITVGGQVRWAQGAAWNITVNYTQGTYATAVESLRVWIQGLNANPVAPTFNFTNISPSSPSNCGGFSCTGTPAYAAQIYWGSGSIPTGTYSVLATLNSPSANITTQAMTFTLGVITGSSPTCVSNSPSGLINTQFP